MDREADRAEPAQAGRLTRLPENARDTPDHRRSGAAPWNYLFQSRCIGLALPAVGPLVGSAARRGHAGQQRNHHARRGRGGFGHRFARHVRFPQFTGFRKTAAAGRRRRSRARSRLHCLSLCEARVRQGSGADCALTRRLRDTALLGAIAQGWRSASQADLCPLSYVDVPERAYISGTLGVYEMTRTELLRDVFVWAYERSCQKYVVIRDSVAEPDLFRMRYRNALIDVGGEIVRERKRPTEDEIHALAERLVEPHDVPRFVELVTQDFRRINEGNIARYRIRLADYWAWLNALKANAGR